MTFHQMTKCTPDFAAPFEWPVLPDAESVSAQMPVGSAEMTIADQIVTLKSAAAPVDASMMVTLRLGDDTVQIFMPDHAIGALLDLHAIDDDWENYKPDTTAIVIEHLMHPVLAGDFAVLSYGGPGTATPDFGVIATLPCGDTLPFGVAAPARILDQLMGHFSANSAMRGAPDLDTLPFELILLGPSFRVSAAMLAACVPGDGFLLEKDWSGLARGQVSIGGQVCAAARHTESGFQLCRPITMPQEKEFPMSMTEAHQTDALPVTLQICLGATTLTLSQLRSMEEGDVLPFAAELPTHVDISANGQPFGSGDLVRIDGQVAVRMTKIGQDSWKT